MLRTSAFSAAILAANISLCHADIVYQPVNPIFGGNPLNSSHIQYLESSQKLHEERREEQESSERFLKLLESRLLSSLSAQVADAIFGENALPSGTVAFSDQKVDFVNTGTEVQLLVTDLTTGQVTSIVIPTLQ